MPKSAAPGWGSIQSHALCRAGKRMTETELSMHIAALPKIQVDRQQQRTKRSQRKYQGQQKDDRLLSLVRLPGYFPYRGYLTCDVSTKSLLHTGVYIKYPKSSNRQRHLKRQSAKRVRKNPLHGKGNQYRKVFDYKWELD